MIEEMSDDKRFDDDDYQYNQYLLNINKKEYEFDKRRENVKQQKHENNKNYRNWNWID